MTDPRQAAIDRFRQAVQGVWLDVLLRSNKDPQHLSTYLENAQTRTNELAAKFYDLAAGKTEANGAPAQHQRSK